jgi:hypothetical protein
MGLEKIKTIGYCYIKPFGRHKMAIDFVGKIEKVGGLERIEKIDGKYFYENIEFIKNVMGILPEDEIINFTKEYGFSMFNNSVYIKSTEKNDFLADGEIELGIIYGFGNSRDSIKEIIKTYFIEEQLNKKFYPLFEGYPGDIVFYSLEKETFGKIYYWHHESEIGKDTFLIKKSFKELINNLHNIKEETISMEKKPVIIKAEYSNDLLNMLKEFKK